jgi:recombination protein RecA
VKVVKNKVAAPFREAVRHLYGEGISRERSARPGGQQQHPGEVGSWFSYKNERIGQGRENARQFLKDNKDTLAKLELEVRKALGLIQQAAAAAAPTTAQRRQRGRRPKWRPCPRERMRRCRQVRDDRRTGTQGPRNRATWWLAS